MPDPGRNRGRIEGERSRERLDRDIEMSQTVFCIAKPQPCFGDALVDRQCALVSRAGCFVLLGVEQHIAEIDESDGVVRRLSERALRANDGVVESLQPSQDRDEVAVGEGVSRIERDRPAQVPLGPWELAQFSLHAAEIEIGVRGIRLEFERFGDLPNALGQIATLAFDDAEQMQRCELLFAVGQDLAIKSRRDIELSGAVRGQSLIENGFQLARSGSSRANERRLI